MSAITEGMLETWDDQANEAAMNVEYGARQSRARIKLLIAEVREQRNLLTMTRMDLAKTRALGLRDAATIAELKERIAELGGATPRPGWAMAGGLQVPVTEEAASDFVSMVRSRMQERISKEPSNGDE